jgi:radical SAM superfamily enzyme YgiQ (UPF0313 family)
VRSSGLAEVQFTVLTPFAGTPLYRRLEAEGRLLPDKGWEHRTLFDVTFEPKQMSVAELERGLRFLFEQTYTRAETRRRQREFVRQKRQGAAPPAEAAEAAEAALTLSDAARRLPLLAAARQG